MTTRTDNRTNASGLLRRLMRRLAWFAGHGEGDTQLRRHSPYLLESLEPRILLDATPAPVTFAASGAATIAVSVAQQSGVDTLRIEGTDGSESFAIIKPLSQVSSIVITGSSGADSLELDASLSALKAREITLQFDAGGGSDSVVGADSDTRWTVSGSGIDARFLGTVNWTVMRATGVEAITGTASVDELSVSGAAVWAIPEIGSARVGTLAVSDFDKLSAGSGSTLDYSAYAEPVEVDLSAASATGFSAIGGFSHVTGSAKGDLLVGNGSANSLDGGGGDDTIDGGAGRDTLSGGAGDDLVRVVRDANVTVTAVDVQVNNVREDEISGFETVSLTGGAGANRLDASLFGGAAVLDGLAGNDQLIGGAGDDTIVGSAGADTLSGGDGSDLLLVQLDDVNTDVQLQTSTLRIDLLTASFSSIESASLFGNDRANTINASTFEGQLTIDGGGGNDTIYGSGGADTLTGGLGADVVFGLGGQDLLVEDTTTNFSLSNDGAAIAGGATTLTRLTNQSARLLLTGATGGTYTLTLDGVTTAAIPWNASSEQAGSALRAALGASPSDVLVSVPVEGYGDTGAIFGQGLVIEFAGARAVLDYASISISTSSLVGTVTSTPLVVTNVQRELDSITGVERIQLSGDAGPNKLDASAYGAGGLVLVGGRGDDRLFGGLGADSIDGGKDQDLLSGGGGADTIDGGDGYDTLTETRDADITLTRTTITVAGVAGGLSGIESAVLTGGASANRIDASAFVTVTADTPLYLLDRAFGLQPLGEGKADLRVSLQGIASPIDVALSGTYVGIQRVTEWDGEKNVTRDKEVPLPIFTVGDAAAAIQAAVRAALVEAGAGSSTFAASVSNGRIVLTSSRTIQSLAAVDGSAAPGQLGLVTSTPATSFNGPQLSSGTVTFSGLAGADTLIGSPGDDFFDVGPGDTISGGGGTDTLRATVGNAVLTDARLTLSGSTSGQVDFTGIDRVHLTGGSGNDSIDASTFTLGPVTLEGAGGADTLKGGSREDVFI
ncbi:MAG: hypothetical protein RIS35_562, partial [Pseudomonadota bacterium]